MTSVDGDREDPLTRKVRAAVEDRGLILPGTVVLAGVSGGADSMCMLDILLELAPAMDFTVEACHLNHSLRGCEADLDMEFVREYCRKRSIPFHHRTADVASFAAAAGRGTEEAGRILRYGFFRECALGRDVRIAVAHHSRDQFETVMLNLIRGAGTAGLAGMRHRSGNIIRPLLDCSPEEIAGYIASHKLAYRTDSTNSEPSADRNRVRLELLPLMQRLFRRDVVRQAARTAELCRMDDDYIRLAAEEIFRAEITECGLPCDGIAGTHPAVVSRLLKLLLEQARGDCRDLSMKQVRAIADLAARRPAGGRIDLAGGLCAVSERGFLRIVPSDALQPADRRQTNARPADQPESLPDEYPAEIPCDRVYESLCCRIVIRTQEMIDDTIENEEELVYNTITWALPRASVEGAVWRRRRPGDRFRPNAGSGSKSMKKYLNEAGIPPEERDRLVFLARGGEVLLILGKAAAYVPDGGCGEKVWISGRYRS